MNTQRPLVMVLLGVIVVLGGGYFGYSRFIVQPIANLEKKRAAAEDSASQSLEKLGDAKVAASQLDDLVRLCLPGDTRIAVERYQIFLLDLFRLAEIPAPNVTAGTPRKPLKTGDLSVIPFSVDFETDIWSFTKLLYAFYSAPRLHQITNLSLTPVTRKDMGPALRVSLSIEAVALGEQTGLVRPGEVVFEPPVSANRDEYGVLVEKNMLYASSPGSTTLHANDPEHVVLTTIFRRKGGGDVEADLIDRAQDASRRVVRVGEEFTVGRVRAVIVDVGLQDMVLNIDGNLYLWQLGTTFSSRTLLSAEEALDREIRNRRRLQNMN